MYCTRLFLWFEDSQCFEEKGNDFFVVSDTKLQIDKKFCRKCFRQFFYTHKFLFLNVSFFGEKNDQKHICV